MNIELPEIEKGLNDITVIHLGKWYYPQTSWNDVNDTVNYCSLDYRWEVYDLSNNQWKLSTIHLAPSGNYSSSLSAVNTYSIDSSEVGTFVRFGLNATFQGTTSDFVYSNAIYVDKHFSSFNNPTEISDMLELWLDGSDVSSLFTDLSGTIPVTRTGDQIGCWKDKSKYKRHATQGTVSQKAFFVANKENQKSAVRGADSPAGNTRLKTPDISTSRVKTSILVSTPYSSFTFSSTCKQARTTSVLSFGSGSPYAVFTSRMGTTATGHWLFVYNDDNYAWTFDNNTEGLYSFNECSNLTSISHTTGTGAQNINNITNSSGDQFLNLIQKPYATMLSIGKPYANCTRSFAGANSMIQLYVTGDSAQTANKSNTFYPINLFSNQNQYTMRFQGIYNEITVAGSFIGTINEVLVLNKTISPNDYLIIYNYLKNKWNVN